MTSSGGTHPEIVDQSRQRDRILEAANMDLETLIVLADDYEAAHMPCAAADLRRRLEHFQEREILEVW